MKPYFLSREHPLSDARYERSIQWSNLALAAMLFTCLAGYIWQGVVHLVWGVSLIGLAISAFYAYCSWGEVKYGEAVTPRGSYRRHERPFLFWVITVSDFVIYLVMVTAMFIAGPFSTR